MSKFYVYIYFDPRSQGKYNIFGEEFNYKPVYIGKGKDKRVLQHIKSNKKTKLVNLNRHLIKEGIVPCYKILQTFDRERDAYVFETNLIKLIGREDIGTGPLFNLTDGGEGQSGFIYNMEQRKSRSKNTQVFWNSLSVEERLEIGSKSRENRTPSGIYNGILKRLLTKSLWSQEYKEAVETKRKMSWNKNYCNTAEKKEQRSNKCKDASYKRLIYYITFLREDGTHESAYLKDLIANGWGKDALEWRIKGKLSLDKPYYVKVNNETVIIQKVEKKCYSSS